MSGRKPLSQILQEYAVETALLVRCARTGLLTIRRDGSEPYLLDIDEMRLQLIIKAMALGFTLEEVKILLGAPRIGPRWSR